MAGLQKLKKICVATPRLYSRRGHCYFPEITREEDWEKIMVRYANISQYTILIGAYKGAELPLGDFEMLKLLLDLSEGLGWISAVEIFGKDLVALESVSPYFSTLITYFCHTLNEWWWYFPSTTYEEKLNNNG